MLSVYIKYSSEMVKDKPNHLQEAFSVAKSFKSGFANTQLRFVGDIEFN